MQRDNTQESTTRRDFLKGTAAASAVALASNLGTNFAHAQGNDTFKIGVIGCGGRGSGAAADCLAGAALAGVKAEIVALGDMFGDRMNNLKNKFKVPDDKCFTGFDNYKGVLGAGVDSVILATPPGFRPYHFKAAVDAGKHVFMEKPAAVDPAGVRLALEAAGIAKTKNLCVVAGTQRRHETNYTETIKRIHDGMIGDILHMSVYWNGGGIWWHPRKEGWSDMEYQLRNWYHYVWLCGDQIVEQHLHNLDVANWVLNAHPISAYGMGGRQVRTELGEIWDHTAVEYEYPNGARVLSFGRHWPNADDNVSEFAIGTKGTSNPGGWINVKGGERMNFKNQRSGYQQEHADMFASIKAGKPLNEGVQVAESSMVAVMGRMTAYTGKKVSWDFAMNKSVLDTMPKNLDLKASMPPIVIACPGKTKLI